MRVLQKADSFAKTIDSFQSKHISTDTFTIWFHTYIEHFRCMKGASHFFCAKRYKSIVPECPRIPRLLNFNPSRFYVIFFVRIRFEHNRLPAHAFYLDLNFSLFFALFPSCYTLDIGDFRNIIFHYFNLSFSKINLIKFSFKK